MEPCCVLLSSSRLSKANHGRVNEYILHDYEDLALRRQSVSLARGRLLAPREYTHFPWKMALDKGRPLHAQT